MWLGSKQIDAELGRAGVLLHRCVLQSGRTRTVLSSGRSGR